MLNAAKPYAYIRKSTVGGADSKADQIADVRGLVAEVDATAAPRLRVLDTDWAISARREKVAKRHGLTELQRALDAGEVSALYAKSLDRIARDVESAARILNACERAKVPIHVLIPRKTFAASDPMDRMLFHYEAIRHEQAVDADVLKASQRVVRQKARGAVMGQRFYGEDTGNPARAAERWQDVIDAFRAAGSYHGAATRLTAQGVLSRRAHLTMQRDGQNVTPGWEASTVKRLVVRHNVLVAEGKRPGPAIAMPPAPKMGSRTIATHRFSRLLICPVDGTTLTTIPRATGTPAYACRIGHRDPSHPRPYVIAERYVMPVVRDWVRTVVEARLTKIDASGVERDLTELQTERARVIDYGLKGRLTDAEVDARLAEIDAQVENLSAVKRSTLTVTHGIDWDAPAGEVNARLRELLSGIRLAYAPASEANRVIGRNDLERELDLVPDVPLWRIDADQIAGRFDVELPDGTEVIVTAPPAPAKIVKSLQRAREAYAEHPEDDLPF